MTSKDIDISRFLPSNTAFPNLLEMMYEETPIHNGDMQSFLDLPLNEDYKKQKDLEINSKEISHTNSKSISDDKQNDKATQTTKG